MDLPMPLVTYVGALTIFTLCLMRLTNKSKLPFDALIAAFSAFVASIGILPFLTKPQVDFWLSLLIAAAGIAVIAWIFYRERTFAGRWQVWLVCALFSSGAVLLFWNDYQNNIDGVRIAVALSTERDDQRPSIDSLYSAIWERKVIQKFYEKTGAKIDIVPVHTDVDKRLEEFTKYLNSKSSEIPPAGNMVHVLAIDVIWTGILADYAVDLANEIEDKNDFNSIILRNNTINGKLVGIPWYSDAGLLFYRKDLLKKYNAGNDTAPDTWAQLETLAKRIQEGERAGGAKDFWGFVWQGQPLEPLTCNALEWQISHGGGLLVDKDGKVDINEADAVEALERAKGWIDAISPPDILKHSEAQTFDLWRQGKAAFMRNWPYAYGASAKELDIKNVGISLLPKKDNGTHSASTLGGWQLMVNAASSGKERKAAIRFIRFMAEEENQLSLALENGKLPALVKLYNNPEVMKALPFLDNQSLKNLFVGSQISHILSPRPSRPLGRLYPAVSAISREQVSAILSGQKSAVDGVRYIGNAVRDVLGTNDNKLAPQ